MSNDMKASINPRNPYVKISNDVVDFNFKGKAFSLPLNDIHKMHFRKTTTTYFPAFMGLMVDINDESYKLHIHTKDQNKIVIKMSRDDCWYFTDLVNVVRERQLHPAS
ncbi:hypothetical protein [Flavobacterium sp.]|uniref:hypothetical protein n=1 Tax=Flavobacterium sp. TaxID=239 RepID=UPI002620B166|nr:hypothetical protein [Flavobacterium sp.]